MDIPASCDVMGSTLMFVALTMVPASVYQMMRGLIVVITALMSIIFLGKTVSSPLDWSWSHSPWCFSCWLCFCIWKFWLRIRWVRNCWNPTSSRRLAFYRSYVHYWREITWQLQDWTFPNGGTRRHVGSLLLYFTPPHHVTHCMWCKWIWSKVKRSWLTLQLWLSWELCFRLLSNDSKWHCSHVSSNDYCLHCML